MQLNNEILRLLREDARYTAAQLSSMLGKTEREITEAIEIMEKSGVIAGYQAIVNEEKCDTGTVRALIELKITPQRDRGFDAVAERICNFPQIKSVYLMSGGFDLAIIIEGKTMRDIAYFVADKLATIDGVTATATHFVLQKYKDNGITFEDSEQDERGNSW